VIVVRHSERLDEVDRMTWMALAQELSAQSARRPQCIYDDPPITQNGIDIARRAAITVADMVSEKTNTIKTFPSKHIYEDDGKQCRGDTSESVPTIDDHASKYIPKIEVIFCSKLKRCIETGREVAGYLNVPMVVSRGFAMTAAAVTKDPQFEFLSMDELQAIAQDVQLIDGDICGSPYSIPTER
jgi:broad specificity phosphatase PhoE